MTLVERVAKLIYDIQPIGGSADDCATAILRLVAERQREPNDRMRAAMKEEAFYGSGGEEIWRATHAAFWKGEGIE